MGGGRDFWVRFWGVRGTVPTPGSSTLRYGGNTSCVEVMCGDRRLIFDAGTGLRILGIHLNGEERIDAHLFLTHTHMDHISGFPFFRPAYRAQNQFQLWAGHLLPQGLGVQKVLSELMAAPFFPVPLDIMHACIAFHDFAAGATLEPEPDVTLRTIPLNHPGGATGYRVEFAGRSVCYVTDLEHAPGAPDPDLVAFIHRSEVVIYDATYTDEEFDDYRGWGHSTWQQGARVCEAAGAGTLVTFHHDPNHDDDALDRIAAELERVRPGSLVAREGLVLHP
jgi:phosphoribosyl 1,2-cyclic phosphodiesterase